MKQIGVWLDDFRDPANSAPHTSALRQSGADEIIWVKTYDEFLEVVQGLVQDAPLGERHLCALFFDNDLGDPLGREGHHAFNWFEELCHTQDVPPVFLYTQSSNSAASAGMIQGFKALQRYWFQDGTLVHKS